MNMKKSEGFNKSERFLTNLCRRSFLKLWSHANIFTDEGISKNGTGKELCDQLVVFEDKIIIFSDKKINIKSDMEYNEKNERIYWSRWYKKAVTKSIQQINGAEKWIVENPHRIFFDSKCTQNFNDLINIDSKIYRIAVANGASFECSRKFCAPIGSLIVTSEIIEDAQPFVVGRVDSKFGFVHVFNEDSLEIVMEQFDTISDFITYLDQRETFFKSYQFMANGEEELVGFYYHNNPPGFHQKTKKTDRLLISEGFYEGLISNASYVHGKKLDENSYFIDNIVEHFTEYILNDEEKLNLNKKDFNSLTRSLRELSSENRLSRRVIANALFQKIEILKQNKELQDDIVNTRIVFSPGNESKIYAFIFMDKPYYIDSYESYQDKRREILMAYCIKLLIKYNKKIAIGIASEHPSPNGSSEDIVSIIDKELDEEMIRNADELLKEFNLLQKPMKKNISTSHQFPNGKSNIMAKLARKKRKKR